MLAERKRQTKQGGLNGQNNEKQDSKEYYAIKGINKDLIANKISAV